MAVTIPDWLVPSLISGVLTFAVTVLLLVWKNRRVLLTYHVAHDRVGITTFDKTHGEVQVTVSGNVMQNLFVSSIFLINRSMRDVEDLEVKVFCRTDMRLMSEQTSIAGTVEFLKHTPEFENIKSRLTDAITNTEKVIATQDEATVRNLNQYIDTELLRWYTNRWYAVPVLARGQMIKFTYMTNVISDSDPEIFISCQKAGVRVKYKQPYQPVWHLWGVPLVEAGITGAIIAVLVCTIVILSTSVVWLAAVICLLAGLFGNVPGAVFVRFYRWLRNQLIG